MAQRDAAEKRALEAQRESARLKALSLAGEALSAEPVYSGRPSPRDAEELARLVRGLVFIDDVVLSDRTGLPLTREENRASADLAALAPLVGDVARRLVLSGLPVTQVDLETFGAEHVCARPLEGRAEGAMLLVRTTSQPANPLAIDAVAQAAARGGAFVPGSPSRAASGTTDRIGEADSHVAVAYPLLERELGRDVRAIMLCADGLPLFSAAKDGPSAATRKTPRSLDRRAPARRIRGRPRRRDGRRTPMTQYSVRRTLPAPSEPANFESLVAERDRLRAENLLLRERAEAREAAARESVALAAEVSRLRQALAALRAEDREEERLTPSRREPVLPRPSRLPREWDDAAPLFPEGAPSGHAFDLPPDPAKGLDFGTVSKLSPSELDALPYGLICLDARGRVVHYNDTESRLARLPKERVIGRNFFEDVAPCPRVRGPVLRPRP